MTELPKLQRENCERLIEVLLGVEPAEFNMDFWWLDAECGTVGCLAGHGARDTVLNERGLRLKLTHVDAKDNAHFVPEFEGKTQTDALEAFFGITTLEAFRLFNPPTSNFVTIESACRDIQRLLDTDVAGSRDGE